MLPFEGIRVIEIGSGTALSFCGKLFADFGALVIKVEPPGGDPARREEPLVDIGTHRESAYFGWLNTNKQSVIARLDDAADQIRLRELIAGSDVLLDARALHPERSLAEHYNPLAMAPELIKAHDALDREVDKAFGAPRKLTTVRQRQELLFANYEKLISHQP